MFVCASVCERVRATDTQTHTHTYTYAQARTHTQTRTHTRTCTDTHSWKRVLTALPISIGIVSNSIGANAKGLDKVPHAHCVSIPRKAQEQRLCNLLIHQPNKLHSTHWPTKKKKQNNNNKKKKNNNNKQPHKSMHGTAQNQASPSSFAFLLVSSFVSCLFGFTVFDVLTQDSVVCSLWLLLAGGP